MTVGELKEILSDYLDDTEIVFNPENSTYVEDFSARVYEDAEIRAFYGNDFPALVLLSDGQVGAV